MRSHAQNSFCCRLTSNGQGGNETKKYLVSFGWFFEMNFSQNIGCISSISPHAWGMSLDINLDGEFDITGDDCVQAVSILN